MKEIKRSIYFYLFLEDRQLIDLHAFLNGELRFSTGVQFNVFSALTETTSLISAEELLILGRVPADRWISESELSAAGVDLALCSALTLSGLLLSNSIEPPYPFLRQREERLKLTEWHPKAALYHYLAKQPHTITLEESAVSSIEDVARNSEESFERFISEHGPPPETFYRRNKALDATGTDIKLPLSHHQDDFFSTLLRRRSTRAFDQDRPMKLIDLATILYYTFGCHGYARLATGVSVIKRTSPSGGCLHPIEVYPLIRNVHGVEAGVYHYSVYDHTLERLSVQPESHELRELAIRFLAGQSAAGAAHCLLLMTARFERNFWKYRNNVKTYSVVLMDVGHISQTCYLTCNRLGLGAFFSAALNAPLIERALGIDGITEGAVGVVCCGELPSEGKELGLEFENFVPGETPRT